eukprot:3851871-Amphidinium_carterae.1
MPKEPWPHEEEHQTAEYFCDKYNPPTTAIHMTYSCTFLRVAKLGKHRGKRAFIWTSDMLASDGAVDTLTALLSLTPRRVFHQVCIHPENNAWWPRPLCQERCSSTMAGLTPWVPGYDLEMELRLRPASQSLKFSLLRSGGTMKKGPVTRQHAHPLLTQLMYVLCGTHTPRPLSSPTHEAAAAVTSNNGTLFIQFNYAIILSNT